MSSAAHRARTTVTGASALKLSAACDLPVPSRVKCHDRVIEYDGSDHRQRSTGCVRPGDALSASSDALAGPEIRHVESPGDSMELRLLPVDTDDDGAVLSSRSADEPASVAKPENEQHGAAALSAADQPEATSSQPAGVVARSR